MKHIYKMTQRKRPENAERVVTSFCGFECWESEAEEHNVGTYRQADCINCLLAEKKQLEKRGASLFYRAYRVMERISDLQEDVYE